MMKATLIRDIHGVQSMLAMIKSQIEMMTAIPSPPYAQRSFHRWQLVKLRETFEEETEFLEWRKSFLTRIG
jgi:hypothetical protein